MGLNVTLLYILLSITILHTSTGFRKDLFATRTAYEWVRDPSSSVAKDQFTNILFGGKSCEAIHVGGVLRHGARYPSAVNMKEDVLLQRKLRQMVGNRQMSFIWDWDFDLPAKKSDSISLVGRTEQEDIGGRFGRGLYSLLKNHMDDLEFKVSSTPRTSTSAGDFLRGMSTAVLGEARTNISATMRDDLLRFHEKCEKYVTEVTKNSTYLYEYDNFQKTSAYLNMTKDILGRLATGNNTLSNDDINLLYKMCPDGLQLINNSDWCQIQTDEDRVVLEYLSDIEEYYVRGYGRPLVGDMSCPLVQDFFKTMDDAIRGHANKTNYNVGSFRIGHSDTIGPLYAALGLFRDAVPLTAANFEILKQRKFFVSKIVPFSANVFFILYDCTGSQGTAHSGEVSDNYAVQLYVNEEPVGIPACNSSLCNYREVREHYRRLVDGCDFKSICQLSANPGPIIG